jgi:chemotaxis protein CheX
MVKQECFADMLLDGAREVFETMMFMTLEECHVPSLQVEDPTLLGSITFKGSVEGCLAICFNIDCAKSIAVNMLGMEPDEELSEEDVADAIGEVVNMVMGALKSRIMESVGDVQVSIPSVISGNELVSTLGENSERVSMMVKIDEMLAKIDLLFREVPVQ